MSNHTHRKLQIFVGATSRDLGHARQAVINAILEKGHIPSGMELWAAGNRPPLEVIARHLEGCDAHILLVGARYGALIEGAEQISFTEWEYRQSKNQRPIVPFVFDNASLIAARKAERDKREKQRDHQQKLDQLREELLRTKYVKEFSRDRKRLGELQKNAILAIDELLQSSDVPLNAGWIREDSPEAETVRAVASNRFLLRELDQLRKFSTLGQRVNLDVGSKVAMAQRFWHDMQGRLRRHQYHDLFFESGSTIAYLTEEFERTVLTADEGRHPWRIRTNNVLAVVQFDLHTPIDASRFPAGVPDPDDEYGAIFPNDWARLFEPVPKKPRDLHKEELDAVDTMRREFHGHNRGKQLVLATASGLDLDNKQEHFKGPHVGSHPNMLFKRAIFASGSPVVLFLNAEKLGDPFRVGRCYSVFDSSETWSDVVRRYPMALCIGYERPKESKTANRISQVDVERRNDPDFIRACLDNLGFRVEYFDDDRFPTSSVETEGAGAIMRSNQEFAALLAND